MHQLLKTAVEATCRAGPILLSGYRKSLEIRYKDPRNPVTECDLESERVIRETLLRDYPDSSVLGEEGGRAAGSSALEWIVDPIDGTRNFAHGFPHFCISIAALVEGKLTAAAVLDPVRGERFTALRGEGAELNGQRIRASSRRLLEESMVATGFTQPPPFHGPLMLKMQELTQSVRRTGSAVLDLCYVACGRLDAFWEWRLKPWDLAAGVLICQEAEGTVTLADGRAFALEDGSVLVSNTHLHRAVLDQIRAAQLTSMA